MEEDDVLYELGVDIRSDFTFENGDLKGLESVAKLLPDGDADDVSEIEKLKELVREFEERIFKLKDDYPYNKKELLEDSDACNEYISMLLELIDDRKEDIENLENRINKLIENV